MLKTVLHLFYQHTITMIPDRSIIQNSKLSTKGGVHFGESKSTEFSGRTLATYLLNISTSAPVTFAHYD